MRIDILTLFPALCEEPLSQSIAGRAREAGLLDLRIHNLRDWAAGKHRVTDDAPYGGGPGMVMKPEPVFAAVESLRSPEARVILMSPQGSRFDQGRARTLALLPHLILIAGHYEGVDQRVCEHLADEELSIGDYVLTNGAIAATVVADAVLRLVPGALGDEQSAEQDSFGAGLLDWPHYTRPVDFRGWRVPDVLLSGNHAEIARWRREQALNLTRRNRPDLL